MHLSTLHEGGSVVFALAPVSLCVSAQHPDHFLCLLAKPIGWQNQIFTNYFQVKKPKKTKKNFETKLPFFKCWFGVEDERYVIYSFLNDLFMRDTGGSLLSAAWETFLFNKAAEKCP